MDKGSLIEYGPSNTGKSLGDLSGVVAWWALEGDNIRLEYEDGTEKHIICNHYIFRRFFDTHLRSRYEGDNDRG